MKARLPSPVAAAFITAALLAVSLPLQIIADEDVADGDTRNAVLKTMGYPKGSVIAGRIEHLLYDRGRVTLVDGKVSSFDLVTKDEAKRKRAEKERENAEDKAASDTSRARSEKQGKAEKNKTLADSTFASSPAADRASYWRRFMTTYPFTDVSAQLSTAEEELASEQSSQNETVSRAVLESQISGITNQIALKEALIAPGTTTGKMGRRRARREITKLQNDLAKLRKKLPATVADE